MRLTRRDLILGAGAALLPAPVAAGAPTIALGGHAFGSSWRVVTGPEVDGGAVRLAVEQIVARIDQTMSPYRSTSALSRFNRTPSTGWQAMPAELCAVTGAALETARVTQGAFDPALGPLVARFGFGPIEGATGRWEALAARPDALRKEAAGLTLDLCGIAKGHALDEIAAALGALGLRDALIELGGEVRALGRHPAGRDWQVAIETPGAVRFLAQRLVAPRALALATSGHRANGLSTPLRTGHIIDPATRRPAATGTASVSVLAPNAMQADALATALFAMPRDAAAAFAEAQDIAALFIADDDAETMTGRFAAHVIA